MAYHPRRHRFLGSLENCSLHNGQVGFFQVFAMTSFREVDGSTCILSTETKITISADYPCSVRICGGMSEPDGYGRVEAHRAFEIVETASLCFPQQAHLQRGQVSVAAGSGVLRLHRVRPFQGHG
jgi:hypothetical protein